ncbi:MAG: BatD family protein [Elusimicrobiota bacterium]
MNKNSDKKTELKLLNSSLPAKILVIVFLFTAAVTGITHAVRPRLTLTADKQEIGTGETLKVIAEMSWEQTEDINDIIIIKVTPPSCTLLDLVDSKQTTSSRLTGDGVYAKKVMEYYFTAKEKGEGTIEPVTVEYLAGIGQEVEKEDKDIVKSESISIKVVPYLSSIIKKLVTGLVFTGAAVLLGGIVLFFKKRIKISGNKKIPEKIDTHLEKEFLGGLKLFNKHIVEGDFRKYYAYASAALNNYINKKYGITVTAKTSGTELNKLPEQLGKLFSEWNNMEEKVRFSGYKPEKNELEKLTRETERYFRSLIPDKDPEDTIETVN